MPDEAPRKASRQARRQAPRSAPISADEATTEPIPIQATDAAPIAPVAPVSALRRPGSRLPEEEALSAESPAAGAAAGPALTPAAARKRLRAAKRARRRYEREEVRRFTWRSRRRRTLWLVTLGAALALVLFVIVGVYSPLMALRTIEVVGTERVPLEQVEAALGDQLGTPLPLLDLAEVKRELAQFTLIRSYVTESRPPGTLVVRIVEREPIGVIPSGDGFDLVDAAGVVIQSADEPPEGYPEIEVKNGVDSAGFAAAAAVVGALPDGIRSQLETVTALTTDDVTLTLAEGARVVWGSAEKSEYKAVVLAALMVSNPAGSVDEYDVSSPDSAVVR